MIGFRNEHDPIKVVTMTKVPIRETAEQTRSVIDIADNCCSDGDNVMVYDIGGLKKALAISGYHLMIYCPQEGYSEKANLDVLPK